MSSTADGQTILLTTHYMEEADQLCYRLAIIDHGRLLAMDTPGRRRPHRDRRDGHGQATGDLDRLRRVLDGLDEASCAEVADGVVRCASARGRGCCRACIDVAEATGFAVTDLSATAPTLETVFIELTGKDLRE